MQNVQSIEQRIEKLVIGIDVSKKDLDVAYWHHPQSKSIFLGKFPNSADGFQVIAREVEKKQLETNATSIFIVLEPTGGYEQRLAHFAHELGWDVSLPNPKQVRDWIKGTGRRAKTDRIDALMLAYYGAMQNPYTWKPVSPEVAELESMLNRLEDLKGVQELGLLSKVIEKEVKRQLELPRVEHETRAANPDGSTRFTRPLPGAARMYPETDVKPIAVSKQYVKEVKDNLPESFLKKLSRSRCRCLRPASV